MSSTSSGRPVGRRLHTFGRGHSFSAAETQESETRPARNQPRHGFPP